MSGVYAGISNKARNIKEIYVGVNGVARKVVKAYIGISNKARLIFDKSLPLVKKIESLSFAMQEGAGFHTEAGYFSLSNHAVVGGGYNGSSYNNTVNAYDIDLTKSIPTSLKTARACLTAAAQSEAMYFLGGYNGSYSNVVDRYATDTLTRSNPTTLRVAAANVGCGHLNNGYLMIGGGYTSSSSGSNLVTVINESGTRLTSCENLEVSRSGTVAAHVGSGGARGGFVAFAGGGSSSTVSRYVYYYDEDLICYNDLELSYDCYKNASAVSIGGCAIFFGSTSFSDYNHVQAINRNLTLTAVPNGAMGREYYGAAALNWEIAVCTGGSPLSGGDTSIIEGFDSSLTKTLLGRIEPKNLYYPAMVPYHSDLLICGGLDANGTVYSTTQILSKT